tara:strand:- start:210 stop:947 length:738 start_codon:yes stop_codon:yes gene_type:complete
MKLNIASLIIGRGGSTLKDKNILPVLGHPLLHWTANAALKSRFIKRYYLSSDCEKILKTGIKAGYTSIKRPEELASDSSQSCDAIFHALGIMNNYENVDIVVIQHANVATITSKMIDNCIDILIKKGNEVCTSVIPAHDCSEYHPLRAQSINKDGFLIPYINEINPVSANRQDLPKAIFFDHSFWVVWASSILNMKKQQSNHPWPCMGNKIFPYFTKGCFDVHDFEDIKRTEQWIIENKIKSPNF